MVFTTPDGRTFETKAEWKKHYLSLLSFKDLENVHEGLVRRAPIVNGQGFEIADVKNCTILVLDHSEQVQIDNAVDCKIFVGACCSSVFIRECRNCEFTVACQQLRTRDCDKIDVNLFCTSEPVVEATTNARIFPFNGAYAGIAQAFAAANLSVTQNTWYKVFDFSKDDTSLPQPHYTVIRKRNPEWRVEGGEGEIFNPVPPESDNATDADHAAAGGGGSGGKPGSTTSFSFSQSQEEVEALLRQQQEAADAAQALPPPAGVDGSSSDTLSILPGLKLSDVVADCAERANAAGFATDHAAIRFILQKLDEAQKK